MAATLRLAGHALLFTMLLSLVGGDAAQAASLSGRSTTSVYLLEEPAVPDSERRAWTFQRLKLDVLELSRGLSFRSTLTARNDLAESDLGLTKTRVYHAYLNYASRSRLFETSVGRHFVYAGPGSGVIDGASLRYRPAREVEFRGFAGTLGNEERTELLLASWDEASRWGLWGKYEPVRQFALSAGYETTRRDEQDDTRRLGVGIDLPLSPVSGRAEVRYDFEREQTVNVTVGGTWIPDSSHRVWLEYQDREPELVLGEYFRRVFDLEPSATQQVRGGWRYQIDREWSVSTRFDEVFRETDDERADTFRGSVTWRSYSIGYYLSRGLGGDRDGLIGSARFTPRSDLSLRASVDLQDYKYGEYIPNDNGSASVLVSADYHPSRTWGFATQFEYLNNSRFDSDLRILGRLTYAFRVPLTSPEGGSR